MSILDKFGPNSEYFIPKSPEQAGDNLRSCIPMRRSAAIGYHEAFMGWDVISKRDFFLKIQRNPTDPLWRDCYSFYEKGYEAGALQREENGKALGYLPIE